MSGLFPEGARNTGFYCDGCHRDTSWGVTITVIGSGKYCPDCAEKGNYFLDITKAQVEQLLATQHAKYVEAIEGKRIGTVDTKGGYGEAYNDGVKASLAAIESVKE